MANKKSDPDISSAASELGKRGAKKGGIARANVLTASERKEIAQKAIAARWAKAGKVKVTLVQSEIDDPPKAPAPRLEDEIPFSLMQGTLNFGGVPLECHVLSDGRRVLTHGQVVRVLTGGVDSSNLGRYLRAIPIPNKEFSGGQTLFKIPGNPQIAKGMEATGLVEICDGYMEAAEQPGKLRPNQLHIVKQAQVIVRACAKVGIIALVDEATGYQKIREKRALELKLQAFIAEEMQEWARMFPEEFWLEIARLEGVKYSPRSRPLRWGKYVMAFVYDAIDSDVGKELRRKNPNPHFLKNHHQWLEKFGRDKVHDQIVRDIAIMQTCDTMEEFKATFARVFKKTPLQLRLDDLWSI